MDCNTLLCILGYATFGLLDVVFANFWITGAAIDCNATTILVSNQQDADALKQCVDTNSIITRTNDGNITLTAEASGSITIPNYGQLKSSIIVENNSLLKSLTLECDGGFWTSQILIRNASALQSIVARGSIVSPLNFTLDNLPALETVDMGLVSPVHDFRLMNLPKLQKISVDDPTFIITENLIVEDVGLESLDAFFIATRTPRNVFVRGIPNVSALTYAIREAANVTIIGNGALAMKFNCTKCGDDAINRKRIRRAESLTVSGLSSLSRDNSTAFTGGYIDNLSIGTFKAIGNSFTTLPLDFDGLSALYVQDNPNLTSLLHNTEFRFQAFHDLVLSGNPKLRLSTATQPSNQTSDVELAGLNSTWVWPTVNASTVILEGIIEDGFM
jgi:hypothetical protein